MRLPESEPDDWFAHVPDSLNAAVENWRRAFREACSQNLECAERFAAVVDALVTWLAENPDSARVYFGAPGTDCGPELMGQVLTARQRMTSTVVAFIATCGQPEHRTRIEFLVAAVRQIIREELRRETVDHDRLAYKLTRLFPLLVESTCTAHR